MLTNEQKIKQLLQQVKSVNDLSKKTNDILKKTKILIEKITKSKIKKKTEETKLDLSNYRSFHEALNVINTDTKAKEFLCKMVVSNQTTESSLLFLRSENKIDDESIKYYYGLINKMRNYRNRYNRSLSYSMGIGKKILYFQKKIAEKIKKEKANNALLSGIDDKQPIKQNIKYKVDLNQDTISEIQNVKNGITPCLS